MKFLVRLAIRGYQKLISPVLHLTPAFYARFTDDLVGSPISYVRCDTL